jgi:hypothetical protein
MSWKNTDPRDDINKRDNIVIFRPDSYVGTAHVDSKHTYCIFTSFDDIKNIDADGKWDELWWWTRAPRTNPCVGVDIETEDQRCIHLDDLEKYDALVTSIRNILTDAGIPDHEEYPEEDVDDREKSLRTGGRMIPLDRRVQMLVDIALIGSK